MLNSDQANFLRRAAARDAGDGAAGQQLAARFDVGSSKQHTAGSGHARNASASGRRRGGTTRAVMAAGREKLEEISRVKVDQGLYLFIRISNTGTWERKNPVEDG